MLQVDGSDKYGDKQSSLPEDVQSHRECITSDDAVCCKEENVYC